MKKKLMIITGAVALTGLLGTGVYHSTVSAAEPTLSNTEIEKLITTQYPGTITELELEKEDNRLIYEVEVKDSGVEYDLKIDADTGEILKLEKEIKQEKQVKKQEVKKDQKQKVEVQKESSKNNAMIDVNEAIEIALAKFPGTVEEAELDEDDGRYIYEIEIENGNKEAEFEIDAYSGKIIEMDIDED